MFDYDVLEEFDSGLRVTEELMARKKRAVERAEELRNASRAIRGTSQGLRTRARRLYSANVAS